MYSEIRINAKSNAKKKDYISREMMVLTLFIPMKRGWICLFL